MKLSSLHCKVVNKSKINVSIDFDLSLVENSQSIILSLLKKQFKDFIESNKVAASTVKVFTHNSYAVKFLGRTYTFHMQNQKLTVEFDASAKDLVSAFNNPLSRACLLHNERLLDMLISKDIPSEVIFKEVYKLIKNLRQAEPDSEEPYSVSCSSKTYASVGSVTSLIRLN